MKAMKKAGRVTWPGVTTSCAFEIVRGTGVDGACLWDGLYAAANRLFFLPGHAISHSRERKP